MINRHKIFDIMVLYATVCLCHPCSLVKYAFNFEQKCIIDGNMHSTCFLSFELCLQVEAISHNKYIISLL